MYLNTWLVRFEHMYLWCPFLDPCLKYSLVIEVMVSIELYNDTSSKNPERNGYGLDLNMLIIILYWLLVSYNRRRWCQALAQAI